MSLQGWQETLISAQVAGAATSTVTATSIIPAQAKLTLPPNYFSVGKVLRIRATGQISCSNAPTAQFQVMFGSIKVFDGGANAQGSGGFANSTWNLEIMLTCRAVGSATTANLISTGKFSSDTVNTVALVGKGATQAIPLTAPAVGSGFDSTVTQVVDLQFAWGTSIASNALTCHQYCLEALN